MPYRGSGVDRSHGFYVTGHTFATVSQTSEGHGSTSPAAAGDPPVHFEETLTKSLGDLHPVYWVMLLIGVLFGAGLLWLGAQDGSPGMLAAGAAIELLIAGLLYGTLGLGYRVRVTDEGVEVGPVGDLFWEGQSVDVPFEAVDRVQYNDPDGPYLYGQSDEEAAGAEFFKILPNTTYDKGMNTYHDGVRIERVDGPPVYLGSDRHVELAETIAERSPNAGSAEVLSLADPAL